MFGVGRHTREQALAAALTASLDAIGDGSATLDGCLRRYPQFAAELEPLLRTAARAAVLRRLDPPEAVRLRARYVFLEAAAAQQRPVIIPRAVVRRRGWLTFAPAGMAAVLFAAIAVPVVGSVQAGAVPGDWNYGLKRATERVQLALTVDAADRRLLRLEFASRRLGEIERLSSHGQVAPAHKDQVQALLRDYTRDVQQVKTALPSASVSDSTVQQLQTVNSQAQDVLTQIAGTSAGSQQSAPVAAQAQIALDETKDAVLSLPASPGRSPAPSAAARATAVPPASVPTVTTPTVVAPAPPTPATASPAAPSPTVVPSPSDTPAATPAASSPTPTPLAEPHQGATVPPFNVITTPAAAAAPVRTATDTPVTVATPTRTPEPIDPAATPAPAATTVPLPTIGTGIAVPSATSAPTLATPTPPATRVAAPLVPGSPTPPAVDDTQPVPTPVSTRGAAVLPATILSYPLTAGDNPNIRWVGAPQSLDTILQPVVAKVVVVYYNDAAGQVHTWYPGSPAPTIPAGTLLTIRMREAATLTITAPR